MRRPLAGPARRGRVRAAHRLRQRRQPAAVARARRGSRRSRCARRSAPAAAASCASCSPRACCSRCAAARWAWLLAWSRRAVDPRARPAERPAPATTIAINGRVLLFTLALSVASGLLFGLAPALGAAPPRPARHAEGRRPRIGRRQRALGPRPQPAPAARGRASWRSSVVLLIGAGLLIRSFAQLQDVPPGFNPRGVLTLELTMSGRKYADGAAVLNAYRAALGAARRAARRARGGRRVVAAAQRILRVGADHRRRPRRRRPARTSSTPISASSAGATSRRWTSRCVAGRLFDEQDTPDKPARRDRRRVHGRASSGRARIALGKRIRFGDLDVARRPG